MRPVLVALLVAASVVPASAEPTARPERHALYLEALGKGGYWGLGVEETRGRYGAGITASATWLHGERILSASPYLGVTVLGNRRHAWFAQLGPQLVQHAIESQVPEWDGTSELGVAGQVTSGWELRGAVLVRASLSIIAGPGGVVPWLGVAGGVRW